MGFTRAELQMADDHIAQGERHVSRQLELIAWLKSRGHPTAQAEQLLCEFETALRQHRVHLERMVQSGEI